MRPVVPTVFPVADYVKTITSARHLPVEGTGRNWIWRQDHVVARGVGRQRLRPPVRLVAGGSPIRARPGGVSDPDLGAEG